MSFIKSIPALFAGLLILCLGSCSRIGDIKVTSCEVRSVVPRSMRSVDGVLLVGIDNPSASFTVYDVEGELKYDGRILGHFTADTLRVLRRCSQVYELPASVSLDEQASLLDVLSIASRGTPEGLSADVRLRVKMKKVGKALTFNDLDINRLSRAFER